MFDRLLGEAKYNQIFSNIVNNIPEYCSNRDEFQAIKQAYDKWRREFILKRNSTYSDPQYQTIIDMINFQFSQVLTPDQLDYNNLLIKTIHLFKNFPNILDIYRKTFRYILVDEFQDTNPLQFELLSCLVLGENECNHSSPGIPIFILTDNKQAIYQFQGATPHNLIAAQNAFNCTNLVLKNNYRTNNTDLILLNQFLREGTKGHPQNKIRLTVSLNPAAQARVIYSRIKDYSGPKHNICIIAPHSFLFEEIRNLFDNNGIPYAFLPDYKAKCIEEKYSNIFQQINNLNPTRNSSEKFFTCIQSIIEKDPNWARDDVLVALLDLARNFDKTAVNLSLLEKSHQFYNDILIETNWGNLLRKRVRNKVFLSTVHGVKGLQFSHVHFIGLENYEHINKQICSKCNFGNNYTSIKHSLIEPNNTFYVGVSRTQEELFLYTVNMNGKGKNRLPMCIFSQLTEFVEIPNNIRICGQ